MPRDYDFLSTLLRVGAQHRAAKLMLPAAHDGHGVERDGRGLARRGRGVFAALAGTRQPWVERWVLGPIARLALPPLVARGASPVMLLAVPASLVAVGGCWAIWQGWSAAGLAVITLANVEFPDRRAAGVAARRRGRGAGGRSCDGRGRRRRRSCWPAWWTTG